MTVDLERVRCSAKLPIAAGEGVRCGLLRPGTGDHSGKKRKEQPILVRSFLVQ